MTKENKILIIIIVNVIIVIAEILFGFISNSYALIADALHNMGDALSVAITFIALKLSTKTTTFKETFGFIKAEMMAAFINSLFLLATMIYVMFEAIDKLFNPELINPLYMITVGLIALIANGLSAYYLNNLGISHCHHEHDHKHEHSHKHQEDINIKSAYLHMLGDALISLAVVLAGIFIYLFKIYSIDSILTIFFSIYISYHTYPVLKKSFLSLMDINIVNFKENDLDEIINKHKEIKEYHALHISKPSSKHNFISFHIVLENSNINLAEIEKIRNLIKKDLKLKGFNHIIIQADTLNMLQHSTNCLKCN